jgi:hypothetical protein
MPHIDGTSHQRSAVRSGTLHLGDMAVEVFACGLLEKAQVTHKEQVVLQLRRRTYTLRFRKSCILGSPPSGLKAES